MALSGHELDRALGEDSPRATAVISEVHDCYRCDSYVVIDYTTTSGRPVTAELYESYWDPRPEVGDTVTVLYDGRDPTYYVRDVRLGDDPFGAVMLWTFVASFLTFGIAGLLGRLPRWMVEYRRR